jgi:patatin-related protein
MSTQPELRPERELRLAVVMYGGVSLAIYMNGATQELLHLVRATAPDPADPGRARFSDAELGNTSAMVYRDLARLPSLGAASASGPVNPAGTILQRLVVDILSGTSAGGINAVFLAKALANGQSLDGLARLWQTEADLGLLINDRDSLAGMRDLPAPRNPRSLLNSQRMYRKLLDAFDGMDGAVDGQPKGGLVEELDLFVTTTDLNGLAVRLQLGAGEVAEERRYRKHFHLSFSDRRNDFEKDDNPFLAFISRCSSSFPLAFEPMQFDGAASLLRGMGRPQAAAAGERWARHFAEYTHGGPKDSDPAARPFADGGYLDNKPFSYAIDTIATRRGGDSGRIERKLVYIEPDPERMVLRASGGQPLEAPNAVENALAVIRLRSYETIREELLRLRDRNRLVDKIRSVVSGVDADFEALGEEARGRLADILRQRNEFATRALQQVVEIFGSAYGGYHRLKVAKLTDDLSQIVGAHAGISTDNDQLRALRLMVQAWRGARFAPNPGDPLRAESEFRFLTTYDLSFRIRRASFVIEQINRLAVLAPRELAEEWGKHPSICGGPVAEAIAAEQRDQLAQAFNALRSGLAEVVRDLRASRDTLHSPEPGERVQEIAGHAREIEQAIAQIMAQPTERERDAKVEQLVQAQTGSPLDRMLTDMQAQVAARVKAAADTARARCEKLLQTDGKPQVQRGALNTPEDVVRYIGRHYYTWYELYDSMVFPIVYGSEVGEEIAIVEPIRISPLTGRSAEGLPEPNARLTPSGIGLGHFGAFLNMEWRARDILIGRLNAAEKLIRTVLAGTPHDSPKAVEAFVERAHSAILEEECARTGSIVGSRLSAVYNVDTPAKRLALLREEGLQPTALPSEDVVRWAGRSANVLGKLLRDASEQPTAKRFFAILLYAGYLLSGMVEVLAPRRWWGILLRLWVPRLLVFSLALILLGALFGKEQVSDLGWTSLLILLALVGLTLVLRSWLERQSSPIVRFFTSLLVTAAILLLVVGIVYVPDALDDMGRRIARWGPMQWLSVVAAAVAWLGWSSVRSWRR